MIIGYNIVINISKDFGGQSMVVSLPPTSKILQD